MWPFRKPNPFAVTVGTIQALIQNATERRDMQTVGKLTAALNVVNREALRGSR
jgi:hypothetical protein